MKYELKIFSEEKSILEICNSFWQIKGFEGRYQFEKKIQDIAEEKKLSTSQISQIAKNNSELWVNCSSCMSPFLVKNRNEWNRLISKEFFFENDCQNCRIRKKEMESKDALIKIRALKNLEMEKAFKAKRWELCDGDLTDILIIVADNNRTDKINKELFRSGYGSQSFNNIRWERINKLEDLGLLWVEKDNPLEKRSPVKEYHILNKLREVLFKKYKKEFGNGERILNSNQIEIISTIKDSKTGFIEGEFTIGDNLIIKPFKKYGIKMILDREKAKFILRIKEN